MDAPIDRRGQVHGMLTVIGPYSRRGSQKRIYWLCRCACGVEKEINAYSLSSGRQVSCGCYGPVSSSQRNSTHRLTGTHEYIVWSGIKSRCLYEGNKVSYAKYGGRGITVCQRWEESFEAFLADMGKAPSRKHSIDRIDNSLGYSPENCRWATSQEQANNRRSNVFLTFRGQTKTIADWGREVGISPLTIRQRLTREDWSVERALTEPVRKFKQRASGK